MRSGWNLFFALGAAAVLGAPGLASADPQDAELNDVTLNADAGTITGSIDVSGATSGTFLFKIRKVEVKNGELTLTGPLTANFGRSSQQLNTIAMRLSDGEGVCDMMAVTASAIHLKHLGIDVDSQAADLTVAAASTNGRVLANLLCSATHLLDEPGPLTSSVAALNGIVNRVLTVTAAPSRPRLTNDSFTQPSNSLERHEVRGRPSRPQVNVTYPGDEQPRLKPAHGQRLPSIAPIDDDEAEQ
jgi:hypothetical protein